MEEHQVLPHSKLYVCEALFLESHSVMLCARPDCQLRENPVGGWCQPPVTSMKWPRSSYTANLKRQTLCSLLKAGWNRCGYCGELRLEGRRKTSGVAMIARAKKK